MSLDGGRTDSGGRRAGDWANATTGGYVDDGQLERRVSRRTVLAAAVGTTGMSAPVSGSVGTAGSGATLHVNVYPGPTPVYGRLRDGIGALASDWTSAHEAAASAVEDALSQIEAHASETGRDWIDVAVDRGGPIGSGPSASSPLDAVVPAERVYDRFRSAVAESGGDAEACCHLLLWWGPFDYQIGYGRTLPDDGQVGLGDRPAGLALANVGATEGWDGRPVTRNMAIHETLHTYLSAMDVEALVGTRCDHDLGVVREPESGVVAVSPMATAYAGDRIARRGTLSRLFDGLTRSTDGGTRWNGRGCVHPQSVTGAVADGATWRHSTVLTEETKEAVCRYVERNLG